MKNAKKQDRKQKERLKNGIYDMTLYYISLSKMRTGDDNDYLMGQ